MNNREKIFIDGSRLIIESLARSGSDCFVGYPITPANYLYLYSTQRMENIYHAPDEITTLQWMAGLSAAGRLPVTATSFPGFALMVESINMAYMMELPMVIVLVQRMGPSTGTATAGAQGDISLLNGLISGGYPIPVLSPSDFNDCWTLPSAAVRTAVNLRTPVVILTSKEMVMTSRSFDTSGLKSIETVKRSFYESEEEYVPYKPSDNHVPPMLPLTTDKHRVRITASTHNQHGILQHSSPEALDNTARLQRKMEYNLSDYLEYSYEEDKDADTLIMSYGITSVSAREAYRQIKSKQPVSLLTAKTLLPVAEQYYEIMDKYSHIVIAEENLTGLYADIIAGKRKQSKITRVNAIGRMISSKMIIEGVKTNE